MEPQNVEMCQRTSIAVFAESGPIKMSFEPIEDDWHAPDGDAVQVRVTEEIGEPPTVEFVVQEQWLEYALAWCRARRAHLKAVA